MKKYYRKRKRFVLVEELVRSNFKTLKEFEEYFGISYNTVGRYFEKGSLKMKENSKLYMSIKEKGQMQYVKEVLDLKDVKENNEKMDK